MKFMSFFSGAGMFDHALLRAGMQRVGACEIDRFARKVYAARLGVPDYFPDDVTKIVASEIPDADVWIGGSPCQDFSSGASLHDSRDGLDGDKSSLMLAWLAVAAQKMPTYLVLENVMGMLSGDTDDDTAGDMGEGGADGSAEGSPSWFGAVLGALALAGFHDTAWCVLDGSDFGVAQRRKRVFVLARHSRADAGTWPHPGEVLFDGEGVRRDSSARGEAEQATPTGDPSLLPCNVPALARTLTTNTRYDSESETFITYPDGRIRRLTVTEEEVLQGLPPGWTCLCGCAPYSTTACVCPDGPRHRAIGNGGVVPCVEWIGRRLMRVAGGAR